MSLYMHKPPIPNKIGLKSEVVTSNSEVTGSGIELNSGVSDVSTSIKDLELSSKYSNALVSSRKSLMRSDYKTQQQSGNGKFNPSEKRLNFPLTDFVHLEKFSKVYNNNNNNNNNGKSTDSNTSFLIRLPERHDFTASTASLIVHVPSLSYVSEQVDDDRSDNEFLRSDLSDSQRNRNCPICNILYTDLQQQFDEFHVKKSFSLSTINVNINDNTTATTNNENSSMHYMNTPRLWDILESFSANSSRNFCHFHQNLSIRFNSSLSINHNKTSINLPTYVSLPCLNSLEESITQISVERENDISYNYSYDKCMENTPSISIENADQDIGHNDNNQSNQRVENPKFSPDTVSKCESWLKTWSTS